MATPDELLHAVYREPDSDAHRLVYADVLCERGDPLGEFIQLQIARSQGRKKTLGREKLLLEAEGTSWWPGHPAWFGQNRTIPWEYTDRGFPGTFNCGWPVSEPHIGEQLRDFARLAGEPGWSTVRRLVFYYRVTPQIALQVLNGSPLRSLRRIDSLPADALSGIAAPSPVEDLEIQVRDQTPLPEVACFPSLRRLAVTFEMHTPTATALASVAGAGLLRSLETLELHGVSDGSELSEVLAAFGSSPDSLRAMIVDRCELRGAHAAPDVRLSLDAHDVEAAAAMLAGLPKTALKTVHVEFAQGGFFTKRNTPGLRTAIERAVKKWGKAATVSWKK